MSARTHRTCPRCHAPYAEDAELKTQMGSFRTDATFCPRCHPDEASTLGRHAMPLDQLDEGDGVSDTRITMGFDLAGDDSMVGMRIGSGGYEIIGWETKPGHSDTRGWTRSKNGGSVRPIVNGPGQGKGSLGPSRTMRG